MSVEFAKMMIGGEEQLTVFCPEDCSPIMYKIETVAENPELAMIQIMYNCNRGKVSFLYAIPDMLSLKSFLNDHEVEVLLVAKIIKRICEIVVRARDFLIEQEDIIFDPDLIFIDKSPEDVRMILVPVDKPVSDAGEFRKRISEIVLSLAVYTDDGGGFLERMLNLFKSTFTAEDVLQLCDDYERAETLRRLMGDDGGADMSLTCRTDRSRGTKKHTKEAKENIKGNTTENTKDKTSSVLLVKVIIVLLIMFGIILMIPSEWIDRFPVIN